MRCVKITLDEVLTTHSFAPMDEDRPCYIGRGIMIGGLQSSQKLNKFSYSNSVINYNFISLTDRKDNQ